MINYFCIHFLKKKFLLCKVYSLDNQKRSVQRWKALEAKGNTGISFPLLHTSNDDKALASQGFSRRILKCIISL